LNAACESGGKKLNCKENEFLSQLLISKQAILIEVRRLDTYAWKSPSIDV
jgi:hypothetical protein